MPKLAEDIYSNFHNRLYGAAGTDVNVIADHGNVQIVEGPDGNRFPVATELLSDGPVTAISRPLNPAAVKSASRTHKKKASIVAQSNLF